MSASSGTVLPAHRIEEIRVAWERDLERTFATAPLVRTAPQDPGEKQPRTRVDEVVASRLPRIAREAAERLGVDAPYEILLTPSVQRHVNAQALRGRSPFAIRLVGPVASLLDEAALAALIGHEFGHYLALKRADPPSLIDEAYERGASNRIVKLAYFSAELTADRFSLLACRSLDGMIRLEVALTLLDSPTSLGLRERQFLEQAVRRVEHDDVGRQPEHDIGRIPTEFRLYATWLFWRSRLYQELSGDGPGDLDLREADRRLRKVFEARLDTYLAEELRPKAADPPGISGFVSTARETTSRIGSWTGSLASGARPSTDSPLPRARQKVEPKRPDRDDAGDSAWSAIQDELAELDPVERRFRELERADEKARGPR
jgi:hypothetical protein